MPNIVNNLGLAELKSAFGEAEGMLFFSMAGLTMEENEELRGSMFESGAQVRLVRNRLAKLALADRGLEVDADIFKGNVAIAWGNAEAAIGAAKIVSEAKTLRKEGKIGVRGGVLEGNVLDANDAAALANVPDRMTLQAMLLGALSGPARSLATVLDANQSSLARVLQARADQGE
ncbi:MAG: 50S ribosomal protein L10 [Planctomycetota bacterium]|jgi:large subunit ribosomal protein L10|nr:50S ribosomal protein L10 [Planctomycetota bacterium]MDG2142476.1 50S ribosomal protein L10 [Planctomycetota bacterium]